MIYDQTQKLTKHGLPFDPYIKQRVEAQLKRVLTNYPSMIIIDGISGGGKTTLAVHCADYIQGKEINLNHSIGMGIKQFREKLPEAHKRKDNVFIFDEAGDYDKRGFMQQLNHELNKIWDRYRTFGIILILCLPLFEVLDNRLFDKGIPRLLFHIKPNNKNKNNRIIEVYGHYRMMWLKYNMSKHPIKRTQYKRPNGRGYFYDLAPKRAKLLDELSTAQKLKTTFDVKTDFLSTVKLALKLNVRRMTILEVMKRENINPDLRTAEGTYLNLETARLIRSKIKKHGLPEI